MTLLASLGVYKFLILVSFCLTGIACAILLGLLLRDWKRRQLW